jgi:hypothetical protein
MQLGLPTGDAFPDFFDPIHYPAQVRQRLNVWTSGSDDTKNVVAPQFLPQARKPRPL